MHYWKRKHCSKCLWLILGLVKSPLTWFVSPILVLHTWMVFTSWNGISFNGYGRNLPLLADKPLICHFRQISELRCFPGQISRTSNYLFIFFQLFLSTFFFPFQKSILVTIYFVYIFWNIYFCQTFFFPEKKKVEKNPNFKLLSWTRLNYAPKTPNSPICHFRQIRPRAYPRVTSARATSARATSAGVTSARVTSAGVASARVTSPGVTNSGVPIAGATSAGATSARASNKRRSNNALE